MKYVVVLGDGMSDYPIKEIDYMTPLEKAHTPNIDKLAKSGQVGLCKTVDDSLSPGSDIANLSALGYDPLVYYTGRSPLEAISMGINLNESDIALRCNLVTLSNEKNFKDKTMLDYCAGEISSLDAKEIIQSIEETLGNESIKFYNGVSYRHCLVDSKGSTAINLTPPHDIINKKIKDYLPEGESAEKYLSLIEKSGEVLLNHPINLKRRKEGKREASHIWLWGAGKKPRLDSFFEKYSLKGGIISAVDLLKGIAFAAGMQVINVEGATGTLESNFQGKAEACIQALEQGLDYVFVHIEAPDECSHQGDLLGKIKAIEKVDMVTGIIYNALEKSGEDYTIGVLPDHATPLSLRTHTKDAVPYVIYKKNNMLNKGIQYSEKEAQKGIYLNKGIEFIKHLIKG